MRLQVVKFKLRARFKRLRLSIKIARLLRRYRAQMKKFRPLLVSFIIKVNKFIMRRECSVLFPPDILQKLRKELVLTTSTIDETTRNYVLLAWLRVFCTAVY